MAIDMGIQQVGSAYNVRIIHVAHNKLCTMCKFVNTMCNVVYTVSDYCELCAIYNVSHT